MACRYTYQGKTYEAVEFDDVLRAMRPDTAAQYMPTVKPMPAAPFVTATDKWLTLALKRILVMAAQEGYDKVAFINGDQSAQRYDLSKQVRSIAWTGRGNDTEKTVTITPNSGNDIEFKVQPDGAVGSMGGRSTGNEFDGKRLDEIVGKDVAERIMGASYGDMRGNGLKVGGEGMKAFYDTIVPNTLKPLLKKLGGGQLEAVALDNSESEFKVNRDSNDPPYRLERKDSPDIIARFKTADEAWAEAERLAALQQPGFTITKGMRDAAFSGMPLFSRQQDTINVDGKERPTTNSKGQPIHPTEDGVRNFWRGFKDSKVIDADGRPLVVYHGTGADFEAFDKNKSGAVWNSDKTGFFFSSEPVTASEYADFAASQTAGAANVMPVYVSLKNPLTLEKFTELTNGIGLRQRHGNGVDALTRFFDDERDLLLRYAKQEKNDGILLEKDGKQLVVAFRPEQIKSATGNQGTYDPDSDDIRFAREVESATTIEPTKDIQSDGPGMRWKGEEGRYQFAPGAWLWDKSVDKAGPRLAWAHLKAPSKELREIMREMKLKVQQAQDTAVDVAKAAAQLSDAEREMVSDIIERELKAGTIPPEHAIRLAATMNAAMDRQTDELIELGMLSRESADIWRGQYLPRFYEGKLAPGMPEPWAKALRRLTGNPSALKGMKGNHLRGRGMYEVINESDLPSWEKMGWTVRDAAYNPSIPSEDGRVQVWRDYTRQERDKMGEIRDSGFRFVMGYMQMQKDIALGRMFERIASDPEMSARMPSGDMTVQVPSKKIAGTGVEVYGKLAGRYVSKETLSQLTGIEESHSDAWTMYRKALGIWKEGKTALNPVAHANNIISNVSMAHFAGVGMYRSDKYLAAMRDFASKSVKIKEAKDAGLFLGTLSEAELYNSLPKELQELANRAESTAEKAGGTVLNLLSFYLRKPMGWAYQAEDTFFRYLIYKDARERGMEPSDAVDYAQRYIFTYDDLPQTARRIRDFGIPFFAYTYKAVPVLLHTALHHPDRMALPAAVLWGVNAAAYAIAAGDDDESWEVRLKRYLTDEAYRDKARKLEELEREHLPVWQKGMTALGTPKTIRLGMDELTKLPIFLDVSRIVPGGDMLDVENNSGGVPWIQPLTPNHPLLSIYSAMMLNKDGYFGKELVDANDTRAEAATKRADWMWKQLTPAVAFGNYHFERVMNAVAQATGEPVRWLPEAVSDNAVATGVGRDGLPVQPKYAAMQTFGLKARPVDLESAEAMDEAKKQQLIRGIDIEMKRLQRLTNKGAVADSVYDNAAEKARVKKDRLREGLTVDGEKRR